MPATQDFCKDKIRKSLEQSLEHRGPEILGLLLFYSLPWQADSRLYLSCPSGMSLHRLPSRTCQLTALWLKQFLSGTTQDAGHSVGQQGRDEDQRAYDQDRNTNEGGSKGGFASVLLKV